MSKAPPQTTAKKWTSQRILARVEDSSSRKANAAPPVSHEHPTPPPPPPTTVQLPPSLFFERQEAVDALSNLYHNTETVKKIEMGPTIFEPRDSSRFHNDLLECLKSAGFA